MTTTVQSAWPIKLSSPVPAEGSGACSAGGLHWPEDLPQHVVAGSFLQDVLHCLVLQAAGTQG